MIATEPRDQDGDLRALTVAIERQRPRLALGPLTAGEAARLLTDPSGHPPPADLVATLMTATGGIPALVSAVIAAPRPHAAPAITQGALFALIERLRRLDEAELDALLITSLSSELGAADVAAALGAPVESARVLVDRVRATGLVEPSHPPRFLRQVHRAVAQIVGTARHHDLESALLRTQAEMSTLSTELALRLAEHGVRDPRLADLLRRHAGAVRGDTALTVRVYRAAVGPRHRVAGPARRRPRRRRRLRHRGGPGRRPARLRRPGRTRRSRPGGRRCRGHDGNLTQAAELFSWLGPDSDAAVSAAAAVASIGTGDAVAARAALATGNGARHRRRHGPPAAWPTGCCSPWRARTRPRRPSSAGHGRRPSGRCGDARQRPGVDHPRRPARRRSGAARSVIGRGGARGWRGRRGLFEHRHRLLLAWVKMQDGQLSAAGSTCRPPIGCTAGTRCGPRPCVPRSPAAAATRRRAEAVVCGHGGAGRVRGGPVLAAAARRAVDGRGPDGPAGPAGAHAGERLRHPRRARRSAVMVGAAALGGGARGHPRQRPAAVAPHGQALAAAAAQSPFARALAGAGRTWLRVLAGQVDPDEVAVAARGLAQFGLTSDATRLAGQAALQADDARASGLMLQLARDLKLAAADTVDEGAADAADPPPRTSAPPGGPRRRRCRTGSARSPNCCCSACPIATSARSCSSRPRRSNITSHASVGASAPNHDRRCCRCSGRCWRRRRDAGHRSREVRAAFVASRTARCDDELEWSQVTHR